jgi:hypothetical protein
VALASWLIADFLRQCISLLLSIVFTEAPTAFSYRLSGNIGRSTGITLSRIADFLGYHFDNVINRFKV